MTIASSRQPTADVHRILHLAGSAGIANELLAAACVSGCLFLQRANIAG